MQLFSTHPLATTSDRPMTVASNSMSALKMIHSERPTTSRMTITVKMNAITFQRPSDDMFMCRKQIRCTTTCTRPRTTMVRMVAWREKPPSMTM